MKIKLGYLEKERMRKEKTISEFYQNNRFWWWISLRCLPYQVCEYLIALGSLTHELNMFSSVQLVLKEFEILCYWHEFLKMNVVLESGWIIEFWRSLSLVLDFIWVRFMNTNVGYRNLKWIWGKYSSLGELRLENEEEKVRQGTGSKSAT